MRERTRRAIVSLSACGGIARLFTQTRENADSICRQWSFVMKACIVFSSCRIFGIKDVMSKHVLSKQALKSICCYSKSTKRPIVLWRNPDLSPSHRLLGGAVCLAVRHWSVATPGGTRWNHAASSSCNRTAAYSTTMAAASDDSATTHSNKSREGDSGTENSASQRHCDWRKTMDCPVGGHRTRRREENTKSPALSPWPYVFVAAE